VNLLTVKEAASRLGVSTATLYLLCNREKPLIRHHRLGVGRSSIRIPEDALAEYIAAGEVTPEPRERRRPYVPQALRY
jgi:excisionase family DNA binding protein